MSHPREDLTALLDGALAPERRAAVEGHLASCDACRAELEALRDAVAALAALPPPPEPSPFFGARLEARIAREAASPASLAWLHRLRWRLALAATGLAVAAAMAIFTVRQHRVAEEQIAANLDLLDDYEVVASVGDVSSAEDAEVVASLDELSPKEGRP